jgi:hypothetical protein
MGEAWLWGRWGRVLEASCGVGEGGRRTRVGGMREREEYGRVYFR